MHANSIRGAFVRGNLLLFNLKHPFTRAKKILASELMYALDKDEAEAEEYLDGLLSRTPSGDAVLGGR